MPDGSDQQGSKEPPVGRLEQILIDQIGRNERNPRQTFRQRTIEQLATSLEDIGLQVPITVYESQSGSTSTYTLLDGERRYRAAKLINWETIPALIVPEPSENENAVRMFNIHMLREEWEEIETAWAIEQIMSETGIENDRELRNLTGLSIDRIRNMKRVLAYPKSIQEKVSGGDLPYQLLVELDKNLLSKRRQEIKSGTEEMVLDLGVTQLRDIFLKKYIDKVEKDIVDLRHVGTLFDTARGEGRIAERAQAALSKLVSNPEATIEEAYEVGAASTVELSKVMRDIVAFPGRLSDLLEGHLDSGQRRDLATATKDLIAHLKGLLKKM